MKIIHGTLMLLGLLSAFTLSAEEAMTSEIKLWADISNSGDVWTILPRTQNPGQKELRYEIDAIKTGRSGNSHTRQSGNVPVSFQENITLASLSMGIPTGETCEVDIKLFDHARLVADLKLRLPQ